MSTQQELAKKRRYLAKLVERLLETVPIYPEDAQYLAHLNRVSDSNLDDEMDALRATLTKHQIPLPMVEDDDDEREV